jgi:hypothetical protein
MFLAVSLTGCHHTAPLPVQSPLPPVSIIDPSDAPTIVDDAMKFVLSDLIIPARTKASDLGVALH